MDVKWDQQSVFDPEIIFGPDNFVDIMISFGFWESLVEWYVLVYNGLGSATFIGAFLSWLPCKTGIIEKILHRGSFLSK